MKKILLTDREKDIIRFTLELLGAGVVISTAVFAPGAGAAVGKFVADLLDLPQERRSRAFYEMKRAGLVRVNQRRGRTWLVLTRKGRARLARYRMEELAIARPRVWDRSWRFIFFDIPRKPRTLNRARDYFRARLKQLGLVPLQMSVWAHPFPCEEEIANIAELYGLQPYIRVALVKSFTGEEKARTKFDL